MFVLFLKRRHFILGCDYRRAIETDRFIDGRLAGAADREMDFLVRAAPHVAPKALANLLRIERVGIALGAVGDVESPARCLCDGGTVAVPAQNRISPEVSGFEPERLRR